MPSGRSHTNRMRTVLLSSSRSSASHRVVTNSGPSSGCWNSHATAAIPSEMNRSRKARGSLSRRRASRSSRRSYGSTRGAVGSEVVLIG